MKALPRLILVALLAGVPLFAGQASAIDGMVVRFGTTEGISGVDVELTRIEGTKAFPLAERQQAGPGGPGVIAPMAAGPADIFSARTNSDGRFGFTNLPPGLYRLLAARSGGAYCPAEYGEREPRGPGTTIVLAEGAAFRDARIELVPSGTISGRVVDENGDPAGRIRVMAIDARWKDGRQELGLVQALFTNDLGEYRLFWLPPGRYYVAAKPEDPHRQNLSVLVLPPDAEPTREVFPVATVTHRLLTTGETVAETVEAVYHGGGADLQAARAIDLAPGANVSGIDIQLGDARGRARTIRGFVFDASGKPVKAAAVSAVPQAEGASIVIPSVMSDADGSFELTIGPGPYTLRAIRTDGRRTNVQDAVIMGNSFAVGAPSAFLPIPAGIDDLEDVAMPLRYGITIDGHVIVEGPDVKGLEADNFGIQMRLIPDKPFFPTSTAGTTTEGFFNVTDVQPGDYHLNVSPILNLYTGPPAIVPVPRDALQNYYVKSIRLGPHDVLNDGLHVGTSIEGELEVVVGSNGGIIQGDIEDSAGGSVSNAAVVLMPEGTPKARPDLYKSVRSDRAGRFTIRAVTPGDYRLFAWSRIEDGIWFDPEFARANRGRGTAVHVVEGQNPSVHLQMVRP